MPNDLWRSHLCFAPVWVYVFLWWKIHLLIPWPHFSTWGSSLYIQPLSLIYTPFHGCFLICTVLSFHSFISLDWAFMFCSPCGLFPLELCLPMCLFFASSNSFLSCVSTLHSSLGCSYRYTFPCICRCRLCIYYFLAVNSLMFFLCQLFSPTYFSYYVTLRIFVFILDLFVCSQSLQIHVLQWWLTILLLLGFGIFVLSSVTNWNY